MSTDTEKTIETLSTVMQIKLGYIEKCTACSQVMLKCGDN